MISYFGVLPNEKCKAPMRIIAQDCCARLFHKEMLRDGGFSTDHRRLDETDVIWYAAPKTAAQSSDKLKEYLECFCFPLLPDSSWKKLTLYEPTDEQWKEKLPGASYHKWQIAEVNAGEVTGYEWYIMVCCLRFPAENPAVITDLFKARDKGLNLSECWLYALHKYMGSSHSFLHTAVTRTAEEKLKDLNIPRDIQKLLDNDLPPKLRIEKDSLISVQGKTSGAIDGYFLQLYPPSGPMDPTGKYMVSYKNVMTQEEYLKFCLKGKKANAADC